MTKILIPRMLKNPIQKMIVKTLKKIGKYNCSTHSLRHTYVTLALESGEDIHNVQKAVGHSNINTTAGYAHTSKDKAILVSNSIKIKRAI